jgi:hypothetical protein
MDGVAMPAAITPAALMMLRRDGANISLDLLMVFPQISGVVLSLGPEGL